MGVLAHFELKILHLKLMKFSDFILYLLLVLKDHLTVSSQTQQNVSYIFYELEIDKLVSN